MYIEPQIVIQRRLVRRMRRTSPGLGAFTDSWIGEFLDNTWRGIWGTVATAFDKDVKKVELSFELPTSMMKGEGKQAYLDIVDKKWTEPTRKFLHQVQPILAYASYIPVFGWIADVAQLVITLDNMRAARAAKEKEDDDTRQMDTDIALLAEKIKNMRKKSLDALVKARTERQNGLATLDPSSPEATQVRAELLDLEKHIIDLQVKLGVPSQNAAIGEKSAIQQAAIQKSEQATVQRAEKAGEQPPAQAAKPIPWGAVATVGGAIALAFLG